MAESTATTVAQPPSTPLAPRLRLGRFALVGGMVMAGGTLLLVCLVELLGVNPHLAYLIQAIASIEASFLLSRHWTWADRRGTGGRKAAGEWLRFHSSRAVTVPANQGLFSLLVGVGAGYLVANAIGIALMAAANFVAAHHLVFLSKKGAS